MLRGGFVVLALLVLAGCARPAPGSIYRDWFATAPTATPAPSGASVNQYFTLNALRLADRLADASNQEDASILDHAQGRITDSYLLIVTKRSVVSAQSSLDEISSLQAPPTLIVPAGRFATAASDVVRALQDTESALSASDSQAQQQLVTATQRRQAAATALVDSLNALVQASWIQATPPPQ